MKKRKFGNGSGLEKMWREVVRNKHLYRCWNCKGEGHECHHVIKRRIKLTRWDWRNGLLLCKSCHRRAESLAFRDKLGKNYKYYSYLLKREQVKFKEHLLEQGITETEFWDRVHKDLKEAL